MKPLQYVERTLSATLTGAAGRFPAVVLTGPRQSGKTTLLAHLFGGSHRYVSLDNPDDRAQAVADPAIFLARFPPPLIVDEVQYAPSLLHAIKADIDRHRADRGRFLITGSQGFSLMAGVTESLAGRAAILRLGSFSIGEDRGFPGGGESPDDILRGPSAPVSSAAAEEEIPALFGEILRGGYPEPALATGMDPRLWHASYVQTYLERDVRALRAVGDLAEFQRFLFALAARSAGLVNFAELSRDLGVAANTVRAWISVLEASGQIAVIRPYHANLGKRMVKRPKVYFLDTGTLSYLLGLRDPEQVGQGIAAGAIFESAVLGQLHRLFLHRGEIPPISFWRTADGHEVDFVAEVNQRLVPIEAKLTASPTAAHAKGIEKFQDLFGDRAGRGMVVCLAPERFPLTRRSDAVPLASLG